MRHLLLLLSVLLVSFGCERTVEPPLTEGAIHPSLPVICYVTEPVNQLDLRALTYDGTLDIAIIGDSYRHQDSALFHADAQGVIDEYLIRPPHTQRAYQVVFNVLSWANKFQCSYDQNGPVGTNLLVCNAGKVAQKVYSYGITPDAMLVLVNKKSGGSGGSVAVVGTGSHDNSDGLFYKKVGSIAAHELGHSLYNFNHVQGSVMGSACNGGGCLINLPYNSAQQDVINQVLTQAAGPHQDSSFPITTITWIAPLANSSWRVNATVSEDAMRVELWTNGVKSQERIYWARDVWANPVNGVTFFQALPSGNNTVVVKAIDAAYNTGSDTLLIIAP